MCHVSSINNISNSTTNWNNIPQFINNLFYIRNIPVFTSSIRINHLFTSKIC
nr:MAG TPA: hypothetical protein [Bacteriophage sp.]